MPCYDYKCSKCKGEFNMYRAITAKSLKARCPKCKKMCSPKISAPAIIVVNGTPRFYK